jgi:hypothetical protein
MATNYPFLIVVFGFLAAAWLSEQCLALLDPGQKARLMDAFARLRKLSLIFVGLFIALVIWKPMIGWGALGLFYTATAIWGVFRASQLGLPRPAFNRFALGRFAVVAGFAICGAIFLVRAL